MTLSTYRMLSHILAFVFSVGERERESSSPWEREKASSPKLNVVSHKRLSTVMAPKISLLRVSFFAAPPPQFNSPHKICLTRVAPPASRGGPIPRSAAPRPTRAPTRGFVSRSRPTRAGTLRQTPCRALPAASDVAPSRGGRGWG